MLISPVRRFAVALLAAATILPFTVAPAGAAEGEGVCSEFSRICRATVTTPGSGGTEGDPTVSNPGSGGEGSSGNSSGKKSGPPKCVGITPRGDVFEGVYGDRLPDQPDPADPIWDGRSPDDGAIYFCLSPKVNNAIGMIGWTFSRNPIELTPPPDPAVLAQQAIDDIDFAPVEVGIAPKAAEGSVGLVGLPVWLWAANPGRNTLGPLDATARLNGYEVTARARLDRIEFDMGEGDPVVCHGPGTPYTKEYGLDPSPDCGYDQGYQSDGHKTVQATSYWTVNWDGIGDADTELLEFPSEPVEIVIAERQVLKQ